MSDHTEDLNGSAPPVGEEIHMPAASILPLINAAALALAIVSITLSWCLVAVFARHLPLTTIRWIADVRRDIAELPLDHCTISGHKVPPTWGPRTAPTAYRPGCALFRGFTAYLRIAARRRSAPRTTSAAKPSRPS